VSQYTLLPVQGRYGKSHAPAPIPNFPCKESAARPVYSLNDFFYDRGFPTPGQTRKEYVPVLYLVPQFSALS